MIEKGVVVRSIIILLGGLLCLVTATAESAEVVITPPPSVESAFRYVIGLGDTLEVVVWKEDDLSKQVVVRIDGRISLPLVGDVDAVGKTPTELAAELKQKLGELIAEPSVSVILIQNRSWRYYVIGQIKQPGEFNIDYPITVLQSLARSGGFLEWAKKDNITIVRKEAGKDKLLKFDYDDFVKGKNIEQNVIITPGDVIVVP